MGPYGCVHMETCSKGNGNDVVINGVLGPIVMAMATAKIAFAFAAVSMNEPLHLSSLPLSLLPVGVTFIKSFDEEKRFTSLVFR